jgi:hypothetical protein
MRQSIILAAHEARRLQSAAVLVRGASAGVGKADERWQGGTEIVIPTDDQLNEAMHQALGYVTKSWPHWVAHEGTVGQLQRPIQFCTDRNALPLVLEIIPPELCCNVGYHICEHFGLDHMAPIEAYMVYVLKIEPRQIVIATLKTLGKWPADWEAPE